MLFCTLATALLLFCPKNILGAQNLTRPSNIMFIVVDNWRPEAGAYGVQDALTPNIDKLANEGTLFSRAYCQIAWCSPSRNSFLTGRQPDVTKAWNFLTSFRDAPGGESFVTLPQYFKERGYFTASSGKVFHPALPANFDYPQSWSIQPVCQHKNDCINRTTKTSKMACALTADMYDADSATANLTLANLAFWKNNATLSSRPFFLASGFQGPRLPWSYPSAVAKRYPAVSDTNITQHPDSPKDTSLDLEWFRPTEIDWYTDVIRAGGVTHASPLAATMQQRVRRAYLSAISHVDDQIGRLLAALKTFGVQDDTAVVLTADHGQNLGEHNMWSMMNLLETSLRIPLIIRPAATRQTADQVTRIYPHPVESLDLYPTVVSLAGLPPPPAEWRLSGSNLVPGMSSGEVVKPVNAAYGQITRCHNCSLSYQNDPQNYQQGCKHDTADARWTVPCAQTPSNLFDWMGMSVRTSEWRYTLWCQWTGRSLAANWSHCTKPELYNHTADTALFDVENNGEGENLAGTEGVMHVEVMMRKLLENRFKKN